CSPLSALLQRAAPSTAVLQPCARRLREGYVVWTLLHFRRSHADLFLHGDYIPLRVTGSRQNHIIAFARRLHDQWCVAAVPRLLSKLIRHGSPPLGQKIWNDTMIELPPDLPAH